MGLIGTCAACGHTIVCEGALTIERGVVGEWRHMGQAEDHRPEPARKAA
jgi:hypothetical protein